MTFSSAVEVPVPLGPVGDPEAVVVALRRLQAESATNLSGGLSAGLRQAQDLVAMDERGTRRGALLTDGEANEGVTDPRASAPGSAPRAPERTRA